LRRSEDCQEGERCLTHDLWCELSQQIYNYLDGITLAEFIQRPSVKEVIDRQVNVNNRVMLHKKSAA